MQEMIKFSSLVLFLSVFVIVTASTDTAAQIREPSKASKAFIKTSSEEVATLSKQLEKLGGNRQHDILPAAGSQTRIAVFRDQKRVDDLFEVHDGSDDIMYVLEGKGFLLLGGSLIDPKEISSGEWRSSAAEGTQKVELKKGDVVMIPRGTVHQRTVTGKGISLLFIKVFAENQPAT